jgi:hypothetical protein
MKLEANRVGDKGTTWQPRPFYRALALFDELLTGAALIVEGDDALGRPRQVGDDEADPRVKLARMPLDLCHNPPGFLPALRLIAEPSGLTRSLGTRG